VAAHRDQGVPPVTATYPALYMIRAVALQLKEDESWFDAAERPMWARLRDGFGYEVP
jgi:hypothetical protein